MSSRNQAVSLIVIGAVLGGLALAPSADLSEYLRTAWRRLHHSVGTLLSSQPAGEPPITDLFVLFMVMFVLMGLTPLFNKLVDRIAAYLKSRGQADVLDRDRVRAVAEGVSTAPEITLELYDFEIIMLRSLARAGWRGLSLKHLAAELHLEPVFVEQNLRSLQGSGLVLSLDLALFGKRFFLGKKGRDYARRQGFLASF